MKIALAQINPIVGDINGNAQKIISIIKNTKSDIAVFPELSVAGYVPQDLLFNKNFLKENMSSLQEIAENTKNKAVIVGFAEMSEDGVYNSAAIISNQQILKICRKICLPNYWSQPSARQFAVV